MKDTLIFRLRFVRGKPFHLVQVALDDQADTQVSIPPWRSTSVFSDNADRQFGHRAASISTKSYMPRLPSTSASTHSKGSPDSSGRHRSQAAICASAFRMPLASTLMSWMV